MGIRLHRLALMAIILFNLKPVHAQQVTFSSSDLPVVIINTGGKPIVNDPKITADMAVISNGAGQRNRLTDPGNAYTGKIGIELRGQSSQGIFPMKSYDIELRNADGSENPVSLLGMPAESDWVLYAPYTDKTLMRNFLSYTLTREMGRWASRCRYVEVIVDNDYKGIYLLLEKIKRGPDRVDISKLLPTDNSGLELTGGYIFSLDKQPNGWFSSFSTPNSVNQAKRQFSYVYPKASDINQPQKDYIKSAVDIFEQSLADPNFQNPINGVRKYADLNSFIDYMIITELSRNVDGYRLSTYLHKPKNTIDGRIKAGPVWDYDLAYRNANFCNGSDVSGWVYNFNYVCPGDGAGLIPFWWGRLTQDTAFVGALKCRWQALRKTTLSDNRIKQLADSVYEVTKEARSRHFQRWPIMGTFVWPNPNPIPKSYEEELSSLTYWTSLRAMWIDANLENSGTCGTWIDNITEDMVVKNFPNPFQGSTILQVLSKEAQALYVKVYDMRGILMHNSEHAIFRGGNNIELHAERWPAGIYQVIATNTTGTRTFLRIVKR